MIGIALALLASAAWAEAPATSLRPMSRPTGDAVLPAPVATPTPTPTAAIPRVRPKPRPAGLLALSEPAVSPSAGPTTEPEVTPEPSPEPRSNKPTKKPKATQKGSVCGDPEIKGEALAAIKGKVKGCGLDKPVRVTSVAGIRLNQPATISCETAAAFKQWINAGLRPSVGKREVVEIRIAASYICRSRNNKKGAKISEHGRGRALDVAGFVFSDGSQWSVAKDYNKQVRRAHKAACGIFGTTLGPGSDGYHEDHLHFDIASYRGGPYCK